MINLNGPWKYLQDKNDSLAIPGVLKKIKNAPVMNVPSNWENEGLNNFDGTVWYIKEFTLNESDLSNGIKKLFFDGVDYFTSVTLNGSYLGTHEGYFQQFSFDVSSMLQLSNILIVKVTSPREIPKTVWPLKKNLIKGIFNHHDCRPGGWSYKHGQDKNTGGIWNNVYIKNFNYGCFESVKIDSNINLQKNYADLNLNIKAFINNLPAAEISNSREKLTVNITSPDGSLITKNFTPGLSEGNNTFSLKIKIENPFLWFSHDLGTPHLYKITISSELLGDYESTFGIREVALVENTFYLNGKRLFLRGTNIIPEQMLSILTNDRITRQVKLMKEANLNIVRIHAHINRQEYYDECDRQGLLVWQDFPLQWTYNGSKDFIENAVSQIKDMAEQFYNHPSIVFWCCHNEPGDQIESVDIELYNAVHEVDKTRIIRLASNYEEHAYDGWYWGNKEHYAAAPMGPLVTEFGAQALPNLESLKKFIPAKALYPPDYDVWTYHNFQPDMTFNIAGIDKGNSIEEFINNSQIYQSQVIKTAIDFYRRKKFNGINGVFQFMMIDCWPSITWSVVDYYEQPKPGYYTLQEVFSPVYLSVRSRQNKYFPDRKLQIDLWLINDKHENYPESFIKITCGKKTLAKILYGNIEPDSIDFINYEKIDISLKGLLKGFHKIEFSLMCGKNVLSKNSIEIEVVKNV